MPFRLIYVLLCAIVQFFVIWGCVIRCFVIQCSYECSSKLVISMLNLVSFKSYTSKFSLSLSYAGLGCNFVVVLSNVLSNDGVSLGVLSFDLMPQSCNPKNTKSVSFRFSTLLSIKLWLPSTFSIVLWPLSQFTKTTPLLKAFPTNLRTESSSQSIAKLPNPITLKSKQVFRFFNSKLLFKNPNHA